MGYLVLARKYRPQTFDAVVGQQHVTQTLKNAIKAGRVAHAILFSGPRGTGKTTIARILAKAMNCASGPTDTPCNQCRSCTDITAGRGVDVFEIDGASNNSVEQVRELRDNSRYMPAHSRFKIYIIDEVHMLSIAAFNALLKTLEEPPAHVMFFFATTEAHKIPITILSRCQRHDLKRIELNAVVAHMEALCQQEEVVISSGNLWSIARESGGSMRDALSLLDQILACSDGELDDAYVTNLLGGMDRSVFFDFSAAVFAGDLSRILAVIDTVYKNGQDLKRFYADLLMHFRHLMLVKMKVRSEILVDLSPGEIESMAAQVKDVSAALIDQVFTLLFNAEASMRHAFQPRLAMEMVFFKIHQIVPALPIDQLIQRMDSLLSDPQLQAVPEAGIVEAQSAYGSAAVAPPSSASPAPAVENPGSVLPATPVGQEAAADESRPVATDGGDDPWAQVMAAIRDAKPSIAGALSRATRVDVSDKAFTVVLPDNGFTLNLINKNLEMINAVCREQAAGREIKIEAAGDSAGGKEKAAAKQKNNDIRQQLLNHPLVADAVDIFSGKIEEIKIR
ncbi:DNA polymerase III subunit gamma/tau [Desulfosarcina ovata]|uniref:DNA polymerase III subunit gamma/tau n=2 Tax=Desulfosarcina ovata TaxID=83564 RepID=A0A5K8A8F3_9BACT|nr:DNA polymerase III subunit gamma/tau [Desulfosarcina ovata]BBO81677.1 DNA polymerase III subunit gamma/tau [Desulfosarcina ovata subsp. sediminis]BBO88912.1 DNA polymerase III subunit gamma/tau [Desulfosarcina ovata subsp. ovata]